MANTRSFSVCWCDQSYANAIGQYQSTGQINWFEVAVEGDYGGLIGFASYVAFSPTNVTKWTFASGASIGIGFGTAAYIDYQDDGEIFNGSVKWYDYLGATVLGGAIGAVIGAGIGYIAPQIAGALSSFASTSFTLGGGISVSAGGVATMSAGLTITGAQVLTGVGALALAGTLMLMSKHRPGMTKRPPFSWTTQEEGIDAMNRFGGDANKAADYIMNNHFDNWKYGAGNDRNVIKKWLDRIIRKLLGK